MFVNLSCDIDGYPTESGHVIPTKNVNVSFDATDMTIDVFLQQLEEFVRAVGYVPKGPIVVDESNYRPQFG